MEKFIKLLLLSIVLFGAPLSAQAASDVQTIKVTDNFHVLISPAGGNVTVFNGPDGTLIVDDQLSGREEIIADAIKAIDDQGINFILNTHYHFDHTGGNEFFGEQGSIIVSHDNVRKRLNTRQFITQFKREMKPLAKEGLPVVTFSENMSLHFNGDDVQIIHVPHAHTDGDAIAYFKDSNVIVGGDLIFNGRYPFIDTEHGGSIKGLIAGVELMLQHANADTVIIPGHGEIMDKADLTAYKDMLETISGRIAAAIQDGKTLEQVLEMKPAQEFEAVINSDLISADSFTKTLYEDLK